MKIAILLNGYESNYKPLTVKSFQTAITAASLQVIPSTIDFFDPIVARTYPNPSEYDLIILSGGTADPMGSEPWVLEMQDFVRTTVNRHPKQKIVGICWGHQTICVTFGGTVGDRDDAELGVTGFQWTPEGKGMFPSIGMRNLRIHEFHRREIQQPAKGFVELVEGNQSFVNETNTILTFQGHPELNTETAQAMLDAVPSYMGVEGEQKQAIIDTLGSSHDGAELWKRILAWIYE